MRVWGWVIRVGTRPTPRMPWSSEFSRLSLRPSSTPSSADKILTLSPASVWAKAHVFCAYHDLYTASQLSLRFSFHNGQRNPVLVMPTTLRAGEVGRQAPSHSWATHRLALAQWQTATCHNYLGLLANGAHCSCQLGLKFLGLTGIDNVENHLWHGVKGIKQNATSIPILSPGQKEQKGALHEVLCFGFSNSFPTKSSWDIMWQSRVRPGSDAAHR